MAKHDKPVSNIDSGTAQLIRNWHRYKRNITTIKPKDHVGVTESEPHKIITTGLTGPRSLGEHHIVALDSSEILIQQAIEISGDKVDEGVLIKFVNIPWEEILTQVDRDPFFLSKLGWRKTEEIIAAAYKRAGCPDVRLTPRSNDRGRDVIAIIPGQFSIRIVDQVKRYSPGHVVTAEEVSALIGVLVREPNVSKGFVTTTSRFAPGIEKEPGFAALMPHRLELRDGDALNKWLREVVMESKE